MELQVERPDGMYSCRCNREASRFRALGVHVEGISTPSRTIAGHSVRYRHMRLVGASRRAAALEAFLAAGCAKRVARQKRDQIAVAGRVNAL